MDTILSLIKLILGYLPKIYPPLKLEVVWVKYSEYIDSPDDAIVLVTPHPRKYVAEVGVTNRSSDSVYIKTCQLTINGERQYEWFRLSSQPEKLDAHEYQKIRLLFPVEHKERPCREGCFELRVVPAVGRPAIVSGSLFIE